MSNNEMRENLGKNSIILTLSPGAVAKNTFFYVTHAGYLEIQAANIHVMDKGDGFFIAFVVSGVGKLMYDGKEYALSVGSKQ